MVCKSFLFLWILTLGLVAAQTPEEIALNEIDTGFNVDEGKDIETWEKYLVKALERVGHKVRAKRSLWVEQLREEWEARERQRMWEEEQERARQYSEDQRQREEDMKQQQEEVALVADPEGFGSSNRRPQGSRYPGFSTQGRPQYLGSLGGSKYPSQNRPQYPSQSQFGAQPTQNRPQYAVGPQQNFPRPGFNRPGGFQDRRDVQRYDDSAWVRQMQREAQEMEKRKTFEEQLENERMMSEEKREIEEMEDELEAREIERVYSERDTPHNPRVKRSGDWQEQLAKERAEREKQREEEERHEYQRRQREGYDRAVDLQANARQDSQWINQWYIEKQARDNQKEEENKQESDRVQDEYAQRSGDAAQLGRRAYEDRSLDSTWVDQWENERKATETLENQRIQKELEEGRGQQTYY